MVFKADGDNYLVRVSKGELLSAALDKFIGETGIEGAWVSGIGAANEITVGLYQPASKDYKWKAFNEQMEITSLIGNLAHGADGKMMFHLHGTFADESYQVVGGHVKDFLVTATLELLIQPTKNSIHRKFDGETALQLLALD